MRIKIIVALLCASVGGFEHGSDVFAQNREIRIGWIGALTGPVSKYGASQAADLAVEDINVAGGVRGKKIKLVKEDGQCKGVVAISAFRKLVDVDRVKYVLGGHCSPESVAIAPLVDRAGVLTLASCSTSSKFTGLGKSALRVSPVSTIAGELTAKDALRNGHTRAAVIVEETDYALPQGEKFQESFEGGSGEIVEFLSFASGETDFRAYVTKLRARPIDSLFVATQSTDTALLIFEQLRKLKIEVAVYGNEQVGALANRNVETRKQAAGVVYAEPEFDPDAPASAKFIARYKERYKVDTLPLGIWTAEAYDSVRILADAMERCGEGVAEVRSCLLSVRDYPGVSGKITIAPNGDGVREYVLKELTSAGEQITVSR